MNLVPLAFRGVKYHCLKVAQKVLLHLFKKALLFFGLQSTKVRLFAFNFAIFFALQNKWQILRIFFLRSNCPCNEQVLSEFFAIAL